MLTVGPEMAMVRSQYPADMVPVPMRAKILSSWGHGEIKFRTYMQMVTFGQSDRLLLVGTDVAVTLRTER